MSCMLILKLEEVQGDQVFAVEWRASVESIKRFNPRIRGQIIDNKIGELYEELSKSMPATPISEP